MANVDPEKGTYAVGDFKTVALAGYIRAKVRICPLSVEGWTGRYLFVVGQWGWWVGRRSVDGLGSFVRKKKHFRGVLVLIDLAPEPNHTQQQGGADAALTEVVKKADSE